MFASLQGRSYCDWSSCQEGCTKTVYTCWQVIVEYEIPGINPGSDMETPTAKGKLFPNVKVGVPDNFILIHFLCTQAVIMVPRIHISRKVAKFADHKCDISNEYLSF